MIDPGQVYHIHPINDLEEHFLECVYPAIGMPYCPCKCAPTWRQEGDALLIIHNAFDKREYVERMIEQLRIALLTCEQKN